MGSDAVGALLGLAVLVGILWLCWRAARALTSGRPPRARAFRKEFVPMEAADRRQARKVSPWTGRGPSGLTMAEWQAGRTVPTRRGEKVRSLNEARIADALLAQGLRYEYEPMVCGFRPDFFLPDHGIVIEYWGGKDAKSSAHRRTKTRAYLRAGYGLVSLEAGKPVPLEEDLRRQLWYRLQGR